MKPYRMVPHTLHAVMVPDGTKVYNYLEMLEYFTDSSNCIVITGIMGEQYPVTVEFLSMFYTYAKGGAISMDNLPKRMFEIRAKVDKKNPIVVLADRFRETIPVRNRNGIPFLANRDGVDHGDGEGDFLVSEVHQKGDMNVAGHRYCINGAVFEAIFE